MTIQQLTSAIGLVESDDARSEQSEVIKTQPTATANNCASSAKSRKSLDAERVEHYVEEQVKIKSATRHTNRHILSDFEESPGDTPLVSKQPTSIELASVRSELQLIHSTLADVRKEMIVIQRTKSNSNSSPSSRPHSENSNKTFVMEEEGEVENEAAPIMQRTTTSATTTSEFVRIEDVPETDNESLPVKRHVKPHSATSRHDVDSMLTMPMRDEETSDMSPNSTIANGDMSSKVNGDAGHDEVDESEHYIVNEPDDVEESVLSKDYSREEGSNSQDLTEEEIEITKVTIKHYDDSSTPPPDYSSSQSHHKTRPAPLKRTKGKTPIRNPMPNINQPSTTKSTLMKSKQHDPSLFPTNLKRFERPRDTLHTCLEQLGSSNWEDVMEGLTTLVRLIRHHNDVVDANIYAVVVSLSKHVRNLRSQVSRAACSAASELFLTNPKGLEAEAEELVQSLLNRTADTNKFIRADAFHALETMCDMMQPIKVVMMLTFRGATHQHGAVRCSTAKLLNHLIFRIGCDKIYSLQKDIRDRLILTAANLLMEGSLETRNHTKEIFRQLSMHSYYQRVLLEVIPPNTYRNIEKSLKSIR